MNAQLYFHRSLRDYYKSSIKSFKQIFNDKLFINFANIEAEAEKFTNEYYDKSGSIPGDGSIDMADIAEISLKNGIIFYSELSLVKYEFTAISISSIYHLWEQQTRKFLFDELSHDHNISFTEFCSRGMHDFKEYFTFHNVNIELLHSWELLDELRLLSNVIKHGDGDSAKKLFKRNKNLLKQGEFKIGPKLTLDTTLLEETLNLNQDLFNKYADNIVDFWDELPERSYSDEFGLN